MNKGKTKFKSRLKRINPVDAVIAIIFLVSLITMAYLFVGVVLSDGDAGQDVSVKPVEFRVVISNVNTERLGIVTDEISGTAECDFLKIGDVVYNQDGTAQLGKLVSIDYRVSTASTGYSDSEGNLIYAECPGQIDLILTVRGEEKENTRTIGGQSIRVGAELEFHTHSYFAKGKIVSMDREVQ